MMEPHDSFRVHENIAASLVDVSSGLSGKSAVRELFEVSPPRGGAPYIPKTRFEHAIGPVKLTVLIDQKRPAKACILNIGSGKESGFEGDDHGLYVSPLEIRFVLLQLHQMPPARQSPQVPVEDHQKP